ncbi:MAG: hypothetical protein LBF61_00060 [Azoarcus sp.]|jgi:tRNA(fMet)-specific endonuclease VapC|nr:hypothetical protein [Azoarcus sp.]
MAWEKVRNLPAIRLSSTIFAVGWKRSPYDLSAAAHYGNIRAALEREGMPIGVNDLHIAAHARNRGLVLVTNNMHEFQRVPGLLLGSWA